MLPKFTKRIRRELCIPQENLTSITFSVLACLGSKKCMVLTAHSSLTDGGSDK